MRKAPTKTAVSDMRPEYDFASMKGGVRGKYAKRLRAGTNLVLLEPELAEAFPTTTDAAVNQALRVALEMASVVAGSKGWSDGALRRKRSRVISTAKPRPRRTARR